MSETICILLMVVVPVAAVVFVGIACAAKGARQTCSECGEFINPFCGSEMAMGKRHNDCQRKVIRRMKQRFPDHAVEINAEAAWWGVKL